MNIQWWKTPFFTRGLAYPYNFAHEVGVAILEEVGVLPLLFLGDGIDSNHQLGPVIYSK